MAIALPSQAGVTRTFSEATDRHVDPASLVLSAQHALFKESHRGTNGRLIVYFEDPHSNLSGQTHLSQALREWMERSGHELILTEGGSRDDSMTPLKVSYPDADWSRIAKKFLVEGRLSGEEYLNLSWDHPMKIIGVEEPRLYFDNLKSYAALVSAREEAIAYLSRISVALETLKARRYPKVLLDHERGMSVEAEERFEKRFDAVVRLGLAAGLDLSSYPQIVRARVLLESEKRIDFESANREYTEIVARLIHRGSLSEQPNLFSDASSLKRSGEVLYSHFQKTLNTLAKNGEDPSAFPNFFSYVRYLEDFRSIDLAALLRELEKAEAAAYDRLLSGSADLRLIRDLDVHTGLLHSAYTLKMTSEDYARYVDGHSRYPMPAMLAFVNRALLEEGYPERVVPYRKEIDRGLSEVDRFYGLVAARDEVFIQKIDQVLTDSGKTAAAFICGGYHTENMKRLLRERGYSYTIFAPVVESETNYAKYEQILLEPLAAMRDDRPAPMKSARPVDMIRALKAMENEVTLRALVDDDASFKGARLSAEIPDGFQHTYDPQTVLLVLLEAERAIRTHNQGEVVAVLHHPWTRLLRYIHADRSLVFEDKVLAEEGANGEWTLSPDAGSVIIGLKPFAGGSKAEILLRSAAGELWGLSRSADIHRYGPDGQAEIKWRNISGYEEARALLADLDGPNLFAKKAADRLRKMGDVANEILLTALRHGDKSKIPMRYAFEILGDIGRFDAVRFLLGSLPHWSEYDREHALKVVLKILARILPYAERSDAEYGMQSLSRIAADPSTPEYLAAKAVEIIGGLRPTSGPAAEKAQLATLYAFYADRFPKIIREAAYDAMKKNALTKEYLLGRVKGSVAYGERQGHAKLLDQLGLFDIEAVSYIYGSNGSALVEKISSVFGDNLPTCQEFVASGLYEPDVTPGRVGPLTALVERLVFFKSSLGETDFYKLVYAWKFHRVLTWLSSRSQTRGASLFISKALLDILLMQAPRATDYRLQDRYRDNASLDLNRIPFAGAYIAAGQSSVSGIRSELLELILPSVERLDTALLKELVRAVSMDPQDSEELMALLITYLQFNIVAISEDSSLPRDVSDLLNADIGPVYASAIALAKSLPTLRRGEQADVVGPIMQADELYERKNALFRFVRLKIHRNAGSEDRYMFEDLFDLFRGRIDLERFARHVGPQYRKSFLSSVDRDYLEVFSIHFSRFFERYSERYLEGISDMDPEKVENILKDADFLVSIRYLFPSTSAGEAERDRVIKAIRYLLNAYMATLKRYYATQQSFASKPSESRDDAEGYLDDAEAQLKKRQDIKVRLLQHDPNMEESATHQVYSKRHIALDEYGFPSAGVRAEYSEPKYDSLTQDKFLSLALIEDIRKAYDRIDGTSEDKLRDVSRAIWTLVESLEVSGIATRRMRIAAAVLKNSDITFGQCRDLLGILEQEILEILDNFEDGFGRAALRSIDVTPFEKLKPKFTPTDRRVSALSQDEKIKAAEIVKADLLREHEELAQLRLIFEDLKRPNSFLSEAQKDLVVRRNGNAPLDVYSFGLTDPAGYLRDAHEDFSIDPFVGGKSRSLMDTIRLGLLTPPGFTLSTEFYRLKLSRTEEWRALLRPVLEEHVRQLESQTGDRFPWAGESADLSGGEAQSKTLLVSVRSGSFISMPGMMDTVLNAPLNDRVVQEMIERGEMSPREAYNIYGTFLSSYGSLVYRVPFDKFIEIESQIKDESGVADFSLLDETALRERVVRFKALINSQAAARPEYGAFTGAEDPMDLLMNAVIEVYRSWYGETASAYRNQFKLSDDWLTSVTLQVMVPGERGTNSGTGVVFTHDINTGERRLNGLYKANSSGTALVHGTTVNALPVSQADAQSGERSLQEIQPALYAEVRAAARRIERHLRSAVDLEFTVHEGVFYVLQFRKVDRYKNGGATLELEGHEILLGSGEGLGGGAVTGRVLYGDGVPMKDFKRKVAALRQWMDIRGETDLDIIFLTDALTPEDGLKMMLPEVKGGMAPIAGNVAHALLIIRRHGKSFVGSVEGLRKQGEHWYLNDFPLAEGREGSVITIDGHAKSSGQATSGHIYHGALVLKRPSDDPADGARLAGFTDLHGRRVDAVWFRRGAQIRLTVAGVGDTYLKFSDSTFNKNLSSLAQKAGWGDVRAAKVKRKTRFTLSRDGEAVTVDFTPDGIIGGLRQLAGKKNDQGARLAATPNISTLKNMLLQYYGVESPLEKDGDTMKEKAVKLAAEVEKGAIREQDGKTYVLSSQGTPLIEISSIGTKRFFDENKRWILTVDPFGNKIDELRWENDRFVSLVTLHQNKARIILRADGPGGNVENVYYEKGGREFPIYLFLEPGLDLNDAGAIPHSFRRGTQEIPLPLSYTYDPRRGLSDSVMRVIAYLAKDRGRLLTYIGHDATPFLYHALSRVVEMPDSYYQLSAHQKYMQEEDIVRDRVWTPDPSERVFNVESGVFVDVRHGHPQKMYLYDESEADGSRELVYEVDPSEPSQYVVYFSDPATGKKLSHIQLGVVDSLGNWLDQAEDGARLTTMRIEGSDTIEVRDVPNNFQAIQAAKKFLKEGESIIHNQTKEIKSGDVVTGYFFKVKMPEQPGPRGPSGGGGLTKAAARLSSDAVHTKPIRDLTLRDVLTILKEPSTTVSFSPLNPQSGDTPHQAYKYLIETPTHHYEVYRPFLAGEPEPGEERYDHLELERFEVPYAPSFVKHYSKTVTLGSDFQAEEYGEAIRLLHEKALAWPRSGTYIGSGDKNFMEAEVSRLIGTGQFGYVQGVDGFYPVDDVKNQWHVVDKLAGRNGFAVEEFAIFTDRNESGGFDFIRVLPLSAILKDEMEPLTASESQYRLPIHDIAGKRFDLSDDLAIEFVREGGQVYAELSFWNISAGRFLFEPSSARPAYELQLWDSGGMYSVHRVQVTDFGRPFSSGGFSRPTEGDERRATFRLSGDHILIRELGRRPLFKPEDLKQDDSVFGEAPDTISLTAFGQRVVDRPYVGQEIAEALTVIVKERDNISIRFAAGEDIPIRRALDQVLGVDAATVSGYAELYYAVDAEDLEEWAARMETGGEDSIRYRLQAGLGEDGEYYEISLVASDGPDAGTGSGSRLSVQYAADPVAMLQAPHTRPLVLSLLQSRVLQSGEVVTLGAPDGFVGFGIAPTTGGYVLNVFPSAGGLTGAAAMTVPFIIPRAEVLGYRRPVEAVSATGARLSADPAQEWVDEEDRQIGVFDRAIAKQLARAPEAGAASSAVHGTLDINLDMLLPEHDETGTEFANNILLLIEAIGEIRQSADHKGVQFHFYSASADAALVEKALAAGLASYESGESSSGQDRIRLTGLKDLIEGQGYAVLAQAKPGYLTPLRPALRYAIYLLSLRNDPHASPDDIRDSVLQELRRLAGNPAGQTLAGRHILGFAKGDLGSEQLLVAEAYRIQPLTPVLSGTFAAYIAKLRSTTTSA